MTSVTTATATATTAAAKDAAKLGDDYSTFLKLLTEQLKNQDPTSPLDTNQFTSQLVQYSSVEQQIKQNKNLETLISQNETSSLTSAAGYIGQEVTADAQTGSLGSDGMKWSYNLGSNAQSTQVTVQNSYGGTVATLAGSTGRGSHTIAWDGRQSDGTRAPDGKYTLVVKATDSGGNDITTSVKLRGKVTAVESSSDGIDVMLGSTAIPISKISRIDAITAPQNVVSATLN